MNTKEQIMAEAMKYALRFIPIPDSPYEAHFLEIQEHYIAGASERNEEVKQLEAKLEFYRQTTDKVCELVFNDKEIGKPCQPLYDAIVEEIQRLRKENEELREQVRQLNAGMIHFSTLDKMPTLDLLDRNGVIEHVVNIGKKKVITNL